MAKEKARMELGTTELAETTTHSKLETTEEQEKTKTWKLKQGPRRKLEATEAEKERKTQNKL